MASQLTPNMRRRSPSDNVIVLPSSTSVIVRDTDIENVVTTAVEFPVAHTLMKNIMAAKHERVG